MSEYLEHPKVIQARQLLCEAAREIKQAHDEEIAAQFCKCGHRRDSHGPSYSINYTGGVCFKGAGCTCKCLHFLGTK